MHLNFKNQTIQFCGATCMPSCASFFPLNILENKKRPYKNATYLVVYELMDTAGEHPFAVHSQQTINHCPLVYGNGLQTLSTPICCNYEPSKRWIQGENDFRYFLFDAVMSEVLPCCDFMQSLKPCKLRTAGSFFSKR